MSYKLELDRTQLLHLDKVLNAAAVRDRGLANHFEQNGHHGQASAATQSAVLTEQLQSAVKLIGPIGGE